MDKLACPIGGRTGLNAGASNCSLGQIWVDGGVRWANQVLQDANRGSKRPLKILYQGPPGLIFRDPVVKKEGGCTVLSRSCFCSHPLVPPTCLSSCHLHPHHTFFSHILNQSQPHAFSQPPMQPMLCCSKTHSSLTHVPDSQPSPPLAVSQVCTKCLI